MKRPVPLAPIRVAGTRAAELPATVTLARPKAMTAPPEGDAWLHEIKLAGRRLAARIDDGHVRLQAADGEDLDERLPSLVDRLSRLPVRTALLDGIATVVEPSGATSRPALERAIATGEDARVVYFAFDLLHLDGRDLRPARLEDRKSALQDLLDRAGDPAVRLSGHVVGGGPEFLRHACELAVEGAVSKKRDAPYRSGRRSDWVEAPCTDAGTPRPARSGDPVSKDRPRRGGPRVEVAGVSLSNADRVLWPDQGITKLELARFYVRIADWILPDLVGRPLTLVRCPDGLAGDCVYQKHRGYWAPEALRRIQIQEKHKVGDYLVVDDLAGLVGLVQMDILEIHTWNSRVGSIEAPDRVVVDLDPGPRVSWRRVIEAAHLVRELLRARGLESFVKTTGGKGLHVVAPFQPGPGWDACAGFAARLADEMVRAAPTAYTTNMAKSERPGKIFLDVLRNVRGATSVTAYSTRARLGAPISVPVGWDELDAIEAPDAIGLRTLPAHLAARRRDPWAKLSRCRQTLDPTAGPRSG